MMNSMAHDDDFAPNPFRSPGSGDGDLFGAPQNQSFQPQQQQQSFQQNFAQPPVFQQQQQQQQQQQSFQQGGYSLPSGPMDNGGGMPPRNQYSQQQQSQNQGSQQKMGPTSIFGSCMMCFSLDTYRAYFDIDAQDIVMRTKSALVDFYKPEFFRNQVLGVHKTDTLKGPDLYGPFWITMTLIFIVAATGNAHAYLHAENIKEFEFDISHLLNAASILMAYTFVVPAVIWITTQCMSMYALLLVEWVCIYGYSLVPFIPAAFLCLIPASFVSWIVLLVATSMSGLLVVRNVTPAMLATDVGQAKAPPVILAIMGIHFIFLLFMKFSFYRH